MSTMTLDSQSHVSSAKAEDNGFDALAMFAVAVMLLAFVAAVIGGMMESTFVILAGVLLMLGLVIPLYFRGLQAIETE